MVKVYDTTNYLYAQSKSQSEKIKLKNYSHHFDKLNIVIKNLTDSLTIFLLYQYLTLNC